MRNFKRLNPRGPAKEIRQAINELAEILKRQRVAQGIGYKVKESSTGTRLEIARAQTPEEPGGSEIARFKVLTVETNHLVCRKYAANGGAIGNEKIKVMKPPELWTDAEGTLPGGTQIDTLEVVTNQHRTYDVQFTVSIDGVETQKTVVMAEEVYPAYFTDPFLQNIDDAFIWAVKMTGSGGPTIQVDGADVEWLDLNVDARVWRPSERVVEVCVDGTTKFMIVSAASAVSD